MSSARTRVRNLARELVFERPAGIHSAGKVRLADIGLGHSERVDYTPLPWRALPRMLPPVGRDDVFVDIGAGKGRVLCQAARYPFARCVGVELSDELAQIARENAASMRRRRAREIEVVATDATRWPIPDDVSVVFLNNPFVGESFGRTIENLVASLDRRPRRLRMIYVNPLEHDMVMATGRFRLVREWPLRVTRTPDRALMNRARLYEAV